MLKIILTENLHMMYVAHTAKVYFSNFVTFMTFVI